jgi:hypothetical protein
MVTYQCLTIAFLFNKILSDTYYFENFRNPIQIWTSSKFECNTYKVTTAGLLQKIPTIYFLPEKKFKVDQLEHAYKTKKEYYFVLFKSN